MTCDVLTSPTEAVLSRYAAVVLPTACPPGLVDVLERYVAAGGSLLACHSGAFPHALDSELWKLLGVSPTEQGAADATYVDLGENAARFGLLDYPALFVAPSMCVRADAEETLGFFAPPAYDWSWYQQAGSDWHAPGPTTGDAALTLRRHGSGAVAWLGVDPGAHIATWGGNDPWAKQLVARLTAELVVRPLVSLPEAPPSLRLVAARQEDRLVAHLVDLSSGLGASMRPPRRARVGPVRVRVDATRFVALPEVRLDPPGHRLVPEAAGEGFVEVVVPSLEIHGALTMTGLGS